MKQYTKNLLLLGHFPAAEFDWKQVLEDAGWSVDSHSAADQLTPEALTNYTIVIYHPGDGGRGSVIDLLLRLDRHDRSCLLPILDAATADEIVQLIRKGVVDVLLNPVTQADLEKAVSRVYSLQKMRFNNRTYRHELERANQELTESLKILKMDQIAGREVQKSLLPGEPLQYKGYTVTHTIIPSLYLSGDFVAYNLTFDRYILFFLADVSGHGASSAFVTILLRFILKRIISKHVRNNDVTALLRAPEGFIEHVNRQLLATGLEKQITMFAGAINTDTHILRYAVAAQMPMPVFISGNDARFLPGKGKIIGLFEDATWEIEEIVLPEKFRLVMVSDGLLETLPGKDMAEQEQNLIEILASTSGDHDSICRALGLDKLVEVCDDVSMLSISRGEEA